MIDKVSVYIVAESGETIKICESNLRLQSKLDTAIADTFSEIVHLQQSIADEEMKTAEKFRLCLDLKNYLQEMRENADNAG